MFRQEIVDLDFNSSSTSGLRFSTGFADSRVSFTDFEWTDYCPMVFRNLQEFAKVDSEDYTLSIRGHETIKLLYSPRKNGCLPFVSHDDRFVIKTLSKSEMKVFLELLPNYYIHVRDNKNTLITKFYGLYVVKPSGGKKVRFVVKANVLKSDLNIHKCFRLKGSSQGRSVSKDGVDEDPQIAFHLQTSTRNQLLAQIKCDCAFLESAGITDYTLLLGLHVCSTSFDSVMKGRKTAHVAEYLAGSDDGKSTPSPSVSPNPSQSESEQDNCSVDGSESSYDTGPDGKLGFRMPARVVDLRKKQSRSVASHRQANSVILYLGIVDIVAGYSMLKRVGSVFKYLQPDSPAVSASNPSSYLTRFQDIVYKYFPENDSDVSLR